MLPEPRPCWILCTPRTGSTFLCEALNSLSIFPAFDHPKIKECKGPLIEQGQAFNEWLRLYCSFNEFLYHPPPYSKIIYHQYLEVLDSVPNDDKQKPCWYEKRKEVRLLGSRDSEFVKKIFPDMRFVLLKRNVIHQAVSLYFARTTEKYHIYHKRDLEDYLSIKIHQDHSKLLAAYNDATFFNLCWDEFVKNHECFTVHYEDLISNPKKTINCLLGYLNLPLVQEFNSDRVYRMTRPEADHYHDLMELLVRLNLQI